MRIVWWWGYGDFLWFAVVAAGWNGGEVFFFFLLQKYDGIELTSLLSCTAALTVPVSGPRRMDDCACKLWSRVDG